MTGDGVNDGPRCAVRTSGWRWGTAARRWPGRRPTSSWPTTTSSTVVVGGRGGPPGLREHPSLPGLRTLRRRGRDPGHAARPVRRAGLATAGRPDPVDQPAHARAHRVALGAEPAEPHVMERPPRPPEQTVLGDWLWQRVVVIGVIPRRRPSLGLGVWADHTGREWQTMMFLSLTSLQLGVALGLRPRARSRGRTRCCRWALVGALLLALAGVYLPVLTELLGTTPLPFPDTVISVSTAAVGMLARAASSGCAHRRPVTGRDDASAWAAQSTRPRTTRPTSRSTCTAIAHGEVSESVSSCPQATAPDGARACDVEGVADHSARRRTPA